MHAMSTRGALHGGCGPHGARKSILSFLVLLIGLFGKKNCVSINKNVLRRQTAIMRSMGISDVDQAGPLVIAGALLLGPQLASRESQDPPLSRRSLPPPSAPLAPPMTPPGAPATGGSGAT